jgi:hypothetical protein
VTDASYTIADLDDKSAGLQAALAVKDARVRELEATISQWVASHEKRAARYLRKIRGRDDFYTPPPNRVETYHTMPVEEWEAMRAELAALKKPVGQGHDVDAYYRPETCAWCKWFNDHDIMWCDHPRGPGDSTGTKDEPGCDKWEAKEES